MNARLRIILRDCASARQNIRLSDGRNAEADYLRLDQARRALVAYGNDRRSVAALVARWELRRQQRRAESV